MLFLAVSNGPVHCLQLGLSYSSTNVLSVMDNCVVSVVSPCEWKSGRKDAPKHFRSRSSGIPRQELQRRMFFPFLEQLYTEASVVGRFMTTCRSSVVSRSTEAGKSKRFRFPGDYFVEREEGRSEILRVNPGDAILQSQHRFLVRAKAVSLLKQKPMPFSQKSYTRARQTGHSKVLLIHVQHGLSNRIRAYLSAKAFAKATGQIDIHTSPASPESCGGF